MTTEVEDRGSANGSAVESVEEIHERYWNNKDAMEVALAAIRYEPGERWALMVVDQTGRMDFERRMSEREVKQALRLAADLMTEEVWSDRRGRFVRVMLDREAPTRGEVKAQRRKPIPLDVRWAVLERDGHRCTYCGAGPDNVVLHLDHKRPWSKGGPDELENLTTACRDCNLGKKDRLLEPAKRSLSVTGD